MEEEEKPYVEVIQDLCKKDQTLAKAYLTTDEVLSPQLDTDIYKDLLNSIVSQQLSVKVAKVIWNRFLDLFPDRYPEAETVVTMEDEVLRGVGLSRQKLGYIKNVAQFSMEQDISFERLSAMSDDEIIKLLTQIKGIGKWTVQMVLMFAMDRRDVFPVDDLGIQTNMKYWYQIKLEKKELKVKLEEIAENWKPNRSIASKLIWKSNITK